MSNTSKLAAAIVAVMRASKGVPKTGHNSHFNYKFSSIEDVINAVRPAMVENGIVIYPQTIEATVHGDRCDVLATYQVVHTSGESLQVVALGSGQDKQDKASNKAMTSAHKNLLIQLFCLPRGDDPDYAAPPPPEEPDPEPEPVEPFSVVPPPPEEPDPEPEPVEPFSVVQFMSRVGGLGGADESEDYRCLVDWCTDRGWPSPSLVSEARRNKFCLHITQVDVFESLEAFAAKYFEADNA